MADVSDTPAGSAAGPDGRGGGWRNFHGRRRGKALRPSQRRHLAELLPRLRVPSVTRADNPDRAALDLPALFGRRAPVWLEIGFGSGEHLAATARARPDIDLIGAEPFVNGVATLLGKLASGGPGNVRLHPGDARDLIDVLPEGSLARVFLLYPDPWPKARHRKRRFIAGESLAPLARAMAPGAELRLATDVADYAEHAVEAVGASGLFAPVVAAAPDWHRPWEGWPGTRYEAKALREGRAPHYLVWRRS